MTLYALAKPILFSLEPETAHDLTLGALGRKWVVRGLEQLVARHVDARLNLETFGLAFESPLGLAAGLDKQGTAVDAWEAIGFGAVEVGTVTPRPQPGNPRPRLFRLPADHALINRFGFNSVGAEGVARNLARTGPRMLRVGINLGKNKETPNERAADDYSAAVDVLHQHADYFVVNVSSPNTSGLRDLQERTRLRALVSAVVERVREVSPTRGVPVLVKLSPDMSDAELLDAVDASLEAGAAGLIATNTTLSRQGLAAPSILTRQEGGLSGAPLRHRANEVCRILFSHVGGRVPIVGVGGIGDAQSAYERIRSGATLIQIYSALIYRGPGLAVDVLAGLSQLLERDGFKHIQEAVGIDTN